jgi:hypothetical protein
MTDISTGSGPWGASGVADADWSDGFLPALAESVQIGGGPSSSAIVKRDNGIAGYAVQPRRTPW